MKKKVVTYLRVSTTNQLDNTSIEHQREKINLYCKFHDIEIVKEFKDEAQSGKNKDREQYKEMINFVLDKNNEINAIMCYKSDRIHRKLRNLIDMIEDLQERKIEFISITEQFDTSTPQGMLFLQMLGSFAEFERKIIAERTRSGRISNGKNELHPGGRVPLGYKLVNKKLIIDKKKADIVKKIFHMRAKGHKLDDIGAEVGMSKQIISKILKNKTYTGKYSYDGKIENNNINFKVDRIISNYIYNKVNKGGLNPWYLTV